MLCESRGIHVFDATDIFAEEFLERYAHVWPERAKLERLDVPSSDQIFLPIADEEVEQFSRIEQEFRRFPGVIPKLARFKPIEIPALLTGSHNSEGRREMESIAQNVTLPPALREKVKKYLGSSTENLTLQVNADNPTIARLARRSNLSDEISTSAITSLYNNAVMLHSKNITPQNIRTMFAVYGNVVDLLLAEADRSIQVQAELNQLKIIAERNSRASGSKPLARWVSCFVAMPYGDPKSELVYRALEAILEDEPYFWNLIRADEQTVDARLWKNVGSQMEQAHCFIAIISNQNPNVMVEVGRMEAHERALLLLNERGAPKPPQDLRERLYVEYDSTSEKLISDIRDALMRQTEFISQKGEPYLSYTFLNKSGDLGDKACRQLVREFNACNDLLIADPVEIGRRLAVNPKVIETAQDLVRSAVTRYGPASSALR